MQNELRKHAESIFMAGLTRVNSRLLLENVLTLTGDVLQVKTDTEELAINLSQFKKIKLIGFGKAGAQMAAGLCEILGTRLEKGLVVIKDQTQATLPSNVELIISSHPVPDEKSLLAGEKLLAFGHECEEDELILGVISGGASALVEFPAIGLGLDDLKTTTQLLLSSGATINEMNCVRKHLSAIKGGQLARAIYPAVSLNFILSDVVGDDLSVIGSGLTVPDHSTFKDALSVVEKYNLGKKLPVNVLKHLENGKSGIVEETPKNLERVKNILVGTNKQALIAASKKAKELGYDAVILSDKIQGEAREVAYKLFALAKEVEAKNSIRPQCILAGGETTVTIRGTGLGGRNQEMALAYLCKIQSQKHSSSNQVFLSAATDGGDGPTDASGAFASAQLLQTADALKLNLREYLERNDSYHFFEQINGLLKTGTTETNVCDIQILLIDALPITNLP